MQQFPSEMSGNRNIKWQTVLPAYSAASVVALINSYWDWYLHNKFWCHLYRLFILEKTVRPWTQRACCPLTCNMVKFEHGSPHTWCGLHVMWMVIRSLEGIQRPHNKRLYCMLWFQLLNEKYVVTGPGYQMFLRVWFQVSLNLFSSVLFFQLD